MSGTAMKTWIRRIERPASFIAGLAVLAWVYDCIPPYPFVASDGSPTKLRRFGMLRCPSCGLLSNKEHRRLCRGPWRAGEDVSS